MVTSLATVARALGSGEMGKWCARLLTATDRDVVTSPTIPKAAQVRSEVGSPFNTLRRGQNAPHHPILPGARVLRRQRSRHPS